MQRFNTDVLIVGSGGAGMRAAISAQQAGVKVLLVSKGRCAFSGATVTASADVNCDSRSICELLHLPGDMRDSMDAFFEDTMQGGKNINNALLVQTLVEDAPARVKELIDWGAKVKRVYATPGHRYARGLWVDGRQYAMTLLRQMDKYGITIKDHCVVLDLALQEGRVVGAYAIDYITGDYIVISAKSVILATGGAMNIFDVSTACSDLYGDGQAMAYRAGAELVDMEFPMFLLGCASPPAAQGLNFTFALMNQCGAQLYNRLGERYMRRYDPVNMEHATRDTLVVAAMTEILEGRSSPKGGVWVSTKHLPKGLVQHFFEWYREWTDMPKGKYEGFLLEDLFPDLDDGGIEAQPAAHYWNGGIKVDEHGRTTLPGLFAAGEVTGGIHGANRLSGNAMLEILVWGERSGKTAAAWAQALPGNTEATPYCEAFDLAQSTLQGWNGADKTTGLRLELQKHMWEYIGPIRSAKALGDALSHADKLRGQLRDLRCQQTSRRQNREWIDALSLRNMADMLEVTAGAALMREESRASHFRKDYPGMQKEWEGNIMTRKGERPRFKRSGEAIWQYG